MPGEEVWIIIGLGVLLLFLWIAFRLIDKYLTRSKEQSNTEEIAADRTQSETAVKEPELVAVNENLPELPNQPNLADEIYKTLPAEHEKPKYSVMNRVRAYDRIKQYRAARQYKDFQFDARDDEKPEEESPANIKLTPEEYKKVVALGHIEGNN
jgi:hypothetical protein